MLVILMLATTVAPSSLAVPDLGTCGSEWSRGNTELVSLVLSVLDDRKVGSDLQLRVLSIITVESAWRSGVTSSAGAVGLMQLTRAAVTDATIHCGLGDLPEGVDMDIVRDDDILNVILGTCYLQWALEQVGGNMAAALTMYNGGNKQLTRLRERAKVTSETSNYVLQVEYLYQQCLLRSNNK